MFGFLSAKAEEQSAVAEPVGAEGESSAADVNAEKKAENKAEDKAVDKAEDKDATKKESVTSSKAVPEPDASSKGATIGKKSPQNNWWRPGANENEVRMELTPEYSQKLLTAPSVENKGTFKPLWQLVASASGAKVEVVPAASGHRQQLVISSPSADRLHRAKKYVRLVLYSDHAWTKVDTKNDDDGDLSLLTCPEDLWSWVLGKQDCNMMQHADNFGVLVFVMGKRRKLGEVAASKIDKPDEPTFQLAIMGDLHGRCSAQLTFMSAVDWKRPGYNKQLNFFIPDGVDWVHHAVVLPKDDVGKCIGTKGSIKKALCRAAECVIDFLGSTAHICGSASSCDFGMKLIEILRTSKKKEIEGIPEGVEDFCDAINVQTSVVPHLAGRNRKQLDQIEEMEGVMIFLFKPPDDDYDDPEPAGDTSAVFVFAHSPRARLRALLRLDRAVAERLPQEREPEISDEVDVAEDVIKFDQEFIDSDRASMGWTSGQQDNRRKVLEDASGCAIEFIGHCIHIVGTMDERKKAKQYLDWLLPQDSGDRRTAREVKMSATELAELQDFTRVVLTNAEHEALMGAGHQVLDAIEAASGSLLFFQEIVPTELLKAGNRGDFVIAGRRFLLEIIEEPADTSGEIRLRFCTAGEGSVSGSSVSTASIPLLIVGKTEGMGGLSGRSLAVKRVKDFLSNPSAYQQAVMDEASVTAATPAQEKQVEPEEFSSSRPAGGRQQVGERGPPARSQPREAPARRQQEANWGATNTSSNAGSRGRQPHSQDDAGSNAWAKWNSSSDRKSPSDQYGNGWGESKQATSDEKKDKWGNWKGSSAKTDDNSWGSSRGSNWQW